LGYQSPTGLSAIDWRISDPQIDSPETEKFYGERTMYLTGSMLCYWAGPHPQSLPERAQRKNDGIVFGCSNEYAGMSAAAQKVWSEIISKVENSRLVLKASSVGDAEEIRSRFAGWGIDPARLEILSSGNPETELADYQQIDIALDTFPVSGGFAACDALWMGVPVITLAGSTAAGRVGKSVLINVGLGDLVAQSEGEYVAIAVQLAANVSRREDLRRNLRVKMQSSGMMDVQVYTAGLEALYRRVWQDYCSR
jgi:protein O-GlcNAc transferase